MTRSLLSDPHRDASILSPTFLGGIVPDRVLLAVTFGFEAIRRDPSADQFSYDSVGPIPRHLEIAVSFANIVRVAANLDVNVWISLENRRNTVQLLLRLRPELTRCRVERQAVEIEPCFFTYSVSTILDERQEACLDPSLRNVYINAVGQLLLDEVAQVGGAAGSTDGC